jgi:hypothetical protein
MSTTPSPTQYRRSSDTDIERNGDNLILLHTETLEFRVLNAAGAVLWDALPEFDTEELLVSLLAEAHPEVSTESHREHVAKFIEELVAAGFIIPAPR